MPHREELLSCPRVLLASPKNLYLVVEKQREEGLFTSRIELAIPSLFEEFTTAKTFSMKL